MVCVCPKCFGKVCRLPSPCPICSLTLLAPPHLARAFHHISPVKNFIEVTQGMQM